MKRSEDKKEKERQNKRRTNLSSAKERKLDWSCWARVDVMRECLVMIQPARPKGLALGDGFIYAPEIADK